MRHALAKFSAAGWWLLVLGWGGVIFTLSTRGFGPDFTGSLLARALSLLHLHPSVRAFDWIHTGLRKLAHVVEYGIFALLLYGQPTEESGSPCGRAARSIVFWAPRPIL